MEQLTLTHSNEHLTIHKTDSGSFFATFGAKQGDKGHEYEMNLTKEDIEKLREFLR